MPVESASDRAALFSADEFGEEALYTPVGGGAGLPCTVIYDRGRPEAFEVDINSGSGLRGKIAWHRARILADEVAVVEKGGRLAVGAITLEVASRPQLDETGAIWTVDLAEV